MWDKSDNKEGKEDDCNLFGIFNFVCVYIYNSEFPKKQKYFNV